MLKLTSRSFITSKKGETIDGCQDAAAQNEAIGRYAIADGATLSFLPKHWAELLVQRFCRADEISLSLAEKNWAEWIEPIQQEWLAWASKTVQETKTYLLVDRLSKLEPALSTFIGFEFSTDKSEWQALVIGDSCLFHESGSEFKSYPLEKLEDFKYRPKSFASFQKDNPVGGDPDVVTGKVSAGDEFILATDALAKWIVQHRTADRLEEALNHLKQIENETQFNEFVDSARDSEDIRLINDDVTLMIISIEECQTSEIGEMESETEAMETETEAAKFETETENTSASTNYGFLFWAILVGILGFGVGALVLLWLLGR